MNLVKLALIGNPNVGKTTLFNKLTGLHQKVGNYPGVTIDKKLGYFKYNSRHFEIIDLPGTYSLYPSSKDEEIVFKVLNNSYKEKLDKIIVVGNATNLRRSLLLFHQVQDLVTIPVLFVLNMIDQATKRGILIDLESLEKEITTKVIAIDARQGIGIEQVKRHIKELNTIKPLDFDPGVLYKHPVEQLKKFYKFNNLYAAWHCLACGNICHSDNREYLTHIIKRYKIIPKRLKIKETLDRYKKIEIILNNSIINQSSQVYSGVSEKIDHYVTHPFWGYCIFLLLLFLVFQSVYSWAEEPKRIIENYFMIIQNIISNILPKSHLTDILSQGIIPGLSTILAFIPQIFILLLFLLLMEESGYINRVVFFMDRLMRPFGLNGKSIVPLLSASACAIPAIMSARNIENSRDRLITILVTPFIACSARLPVYTLIISLVIPDLKFWIFQLKGLVLMGMYFLGVLAALLGAMILNKVLKKKYKNYLIMEIPPYKWPLLNNILISLWIQLKSFILGAGKIILSVNIILWVLGSFGPSYKYFEKNDQISANKKIPLEKSYLGIVGKKIEPIIRPLGYDWKIGIGLLSSLAAREVFVSTMATVYSLNENNQHKYSLSLQQKMREEYKNGKKVYDLPTGISLLIFYAFSIQCMSTLAIVKREMKSWKWPIIQFIFMTGLAYITSFIVYSILK